MRSLSTWVWCITILLCGCEAKVEVKADPPKPTVVIKKHDSYVELKTEKISSKVVVLDTLPPVTLSVSDDLETQERYVTRTEHQCESSTSIIKYFAVYDRDLMLIQELDEVDQVVDADPGSIGDAELALACPKGKLNV